MCNREQRLPTHAPYTQNMHTDRVRAVEIGAWVLAVGTLGFLLGVTSFAGWIALAVVSLVPLAVILRLWSAASSSMSESIRDVLR